MLTLFDDEPNPATRPTPLSEDERAILAEAKRSGYLNASNQRIAVIARWRTHCRQAGIACVIAKPSIRQGLVEINGKVVARVALDELEHTAKRIAGQMVGGNGISELEDAGNARTDA
jgi:hypothetical protein